MNIKKGLIWLVVAIAPWLAVSLVFGGPINFFESSCFPVVTMNCGGFPSYQFSWSNLVIFVVYLIIAFVIGFTRKNKDSFK